jgi:hypothetical protein
MELPPEAAAQDGRFSYQQARAAGITRHALSRALQAGILVETAHGVYAVASQGLGLDAVAAHAALVRDLQLSSSKAWCAARRSAALLMQLPLIGRPPAVAQMLRDGEASRAHGRNRHLRVGPFPSAHRWEYGGVLMSTPARTVVDIARAEPFRNAVVVADGALRRGVERDDLDAVLSSMRRWPGVAAARAAVRFADGRAESPGESLARVACWRESLPIPEPQVEVYLFGRLLGRVDLMLREYLLAIESDGAIKFTDAGVLPDLIVRQEDLRFAGVDVLRTNWDETFKDTSRFGMRVRERIRERGLRQLPPGVELRSTVVRPQLPLLGSFADAA